MKHLTTPMLTAVFLAGASPLATAQAQIVQGTATVSPISNCPAGQAEGADKTCVTRVESFYRTGIQQPDIDKILAENGWRMASPAEVQSAYENLGLHVAGLHKLSDGTYAAPAQSDVNAVLKRGVNLRGAGAAPFSQGFLYVDAKAPEAPKPQPVASQNVVIGDITITDNTPAPAPTVKCEPWQKKTSEGICASNVSFQELTFSTTSDFDQARIIARERGWVIASNEEVRLATDAFALNVQKAGHTSESIVSAKGPGGFKVELGTAKCPDCLTASSGGFFYLTEAEAGRVQPLPGRRPSPIAYYPNSDWQRITPPTHANLWSDDLSDQHPAKVVYGLGDARLLRKAAATYLRKNGKPSNATATNEFLTKLQASPKLRYLFTPTLLGEAFEAISTPRPDATQRAFRSVFEQYMSYDRYRLDGITYTSWSDFTGANQFSPPTRNDYAAPAANVLPNIPSVSEFQSRNNNPMQISAAGLNTIRLFLEPAGYASLPEFRNSDFGLAGQDMQAIAAGVGVSATLGGAAVTLGLVSKALLGTTIVTKVAVTGATATAAGVSTTTSITTASVTPALLVSKGTITGTAGGASLAGSTAVAVTIAVALAAVIGKSFADLAQADQLSLRLKNSLNAGPQPVDAYALVTAGDAGTRQVNRTAVFSHLLKMLIAEPVDKGFLSVTRPEPPLPIGGAWACGGFGKLKIKQNGFEFTGALGKPNANSAPIENGEIEGAKLSGRISGLNVNLDATVAKNAASLNGTMRDDSGRSQGIKCSRDKPLEYVRLQSKEFKDKYVHNQTGNIGVGEIDTGWWSAQWKIVPGEGDFIKFQNRWRPDEYLHIQSGPLEVGKLGDQGWWSAQWRVTYLENGLATIQNRWKPDHYIHMKGGKVTAAALRDGAQTGRWILE